MSYLPRLQEPLVLIQSLSALVYSQITATNNAGKANTGTWVGLLQRQTKYICLTTLLTTLTTIWERKPAPTATTTTSPNNK